jgi:hypothetical protein
VLTSGGGSAQGLGEHRRIEPPREVKKVQAAPDVIEVGCEHKLTGRRVSPSWERKDEQGCCKLIMDDRAC